MFHSHLVLELPVGEDRFDSAHRAVVDDRRLVSTAALHVSVHGVVAHVQLPPDKPESREKHVTTDPPLERLRLKPSDKKKKRKKHIQLWDVWKVIGAQFSSQTLEKDLEEPDSPCQCFYADLMFFQDLKGYFTGMSLETAVAKLTESCQVINVLMSPDLDI